MAGRGRLITIEGVDGAGKTTLAAALVDALRARGVGRVEALREPGGVALAERVRALVVDPALRCGPRAEALLYAAARAQLVEERLNPLLETGAWVVLDRFVDSSLAYQGAGRGLGVVEVAELNAFATGGLEADRTLLLRVGAAQGRARQAGRGGEPDLLRVGAAQGRARQAGRGGEPDRLEREDAGFFAAAAAGYDALAAAQPRRVRVVDASGSQAAVLTAALEALGDLLEGG